MAPSHPLPIDLNLATEVELIRMLAIPPRLARRIAQMRPYRQVDQLSRVWGMDSETLARILPLVRISTASDGPIQAMGGARPAGGMEPAAAQSSPSASPRTPEEERAIQELLSLPATPAGEVGLEPVPARPRKFPWQSVLILGLILIIGAYFRFNNIRWDQNQHQHPDERFMTMVAERIQPVSLAGYFDTKTSPLNPMQNNAGYTYGMFPLFFTRMVAGWVNMTHYDKVVLVGRIFSGLFDLAAVLLLYFLGKRLFGRRVGYLAAALSAAAVLQIQLSHFFTVDSFSLVFIVAAFLITYQAVPVLTPGARAAWSRLPWYALFGAAAGLAMACKINTIAIAGVLVLAVGADLASNSRVKQERAKRIWVSLAGLALAGLAAFVTFRVFQPYAFMGPGFFGLQLNPRWLQIMRDVTGQVAGSSDWPPNDHWTSRSAIYAWQNMVVWGLGLPLGLAAWAALLFAAWRCFKGEWRRLLLPAAWVAGYFLWQNVQFWRYMRYFVPIYPILLLLAAWGMDEALNKTAASRERMWAAFRTQKPREWAWRKILPGMGVGLACVLIVGWTYLYAAGFSSIYTRPITRIAASEWMLEHIRGPLNVLVKTGQQVRSYPISSPSDLTFAAGEDFHSAFKPLETGSASQVSTQKVTLALVDLRVRLAADPGFKKVISEGHLILPSGNPPDQLIVSMPETILTAGQTYYVQYVMRSGGPFAASGAVFRDENDKDPAVPAGVELSAQAAGSVTGNSRIVPAANTRVNRLVFDRYQGRVAPAEASIQISLTSDDAGSQVLATATDTQQVYGDDHPVAPVFRFPDTRLEAGKTYSLRYKVLSGGPLIFSPETYALETSWDDALPLRIDPYDGLGGIYSPANFEMYDDETPQKRDRMIQVLDQVDYIVMPSNRAYDAMPRLPLRYPLATAYYQQLFNCPACDGDQIEARAYALKPPFHSPLGFDLVATFTSEPSAGPIQLHDESADESFTVYDHPKVLIFKKAADYSSQKVRNLLFAVDLNQVVRQQPLAVSRNPTGYRLPADRLAAQTSGGTWSAMFNPRNLLNSSPVAGGISWYLLIFSLGVLFFPVTFLIFGGLSDRGYTLARLAGLLAVGWAAWLLASLKLAPFTRLAIAAGLVGLVALNLVLVRKRWRELVEFLRDRWSLMLGIEILFAALFLFQIGLRLGNPDLWNPWYGGEKPMDFSILNSVLKTVYFPPQNPWFAGYTLNYYYFGYVLAAVPIKLLGIEPSIAYNLLLPTWFALTGVSIFGLAYNLIQALLPGAVERIRGAASAGGSFSPRRFAWLAGICAVVLMMLLGNLYQPRQLWKYLPEITNPANNAQLTGIARLGAVLSAGGQVVLGRASLPGASSRWFFDASRPILNSGPDTPIVEFPYFTYLYGDLHPHLLSMPYLFFALAWILAFFLGHGKKRGWLQRFAFWAAAGLVFGSFRAAHTWDYPTLLGMAVLAMGWVIWRHDGLNRRSLGRFALGVILAGGLSALFYAPFNQWFATGYSSVELWKGARTPLGDYLSVTGLFLFVFISFLLWESSAGIKRVILIWIDRPLAWLANPRKLAVGLGIGIAGLALLNLLWFYNLQVFVLVLPLLAWIAALLFRRDQPALRRIILALIAIGLCLTLVVEVVVLKGDNGRSNTVFYFYYQVWALFSLAAALILALVFSGWKTWRAGWRWVWAAPLGLLVLGAASFPLMATSAKLNTRWPGIANPPHALDGMDYMLGESQNAGAAPGLTPGAIYDDNGKKLDLGLDYLGIRYMQENVTGTPTIVEGQTTEYRWGSRYSIYTGLPTVAGWSWHVRQHLDLMDGDQVERRIAEVKQFYDTTDEGAAVAFLRKYHVGYIIVGQLEQAYYDPQGIQKFAKMAANGTLTEAFSYTTSNGWIRIYRFSG